MFMTKSFRVLAAAAALALMAPVAQAATIDFVERFEGNDCSGTFGTGFENCTYDKSPIIAKIEFDDKTGTTKLEMNTKVFPGLTADMFSATTVGNSVTFSFDTTAFGGGLGVLLRYVVLKNGPGFDLFKVSEPGFTFTNFTLTSSVSKGISHISFYDTMAPIPLPAAGWLMLAGLGGLVAVRRRRRKAA